MSRFINLLKIEKAMFDSEYMESFDFVHDYCLVSSSSICIVADISVGDAWLRKYYKDKIGSSLFIANSKIGKKIIEEMASAKKIYIEKESVDNIIASQNTNYVKFKTSYIYERRVAFGDLDAHDEAVPKSYKRLIKWIKFNKWLYEAMVRTKVVDFIPELVLKVYGRVSGKIFGILSM